MKKNKILQFVIVGAILLASYATYIMINPINWIGSPESISAKNIAEKPFEDYAGKIPASDIPLLQSTEEFASMTSRDFVTVSTDDVVQTGVYELKKWISPKKLKKAPIGNGRTSTSGRTLPKITTDVLSAVDYYNEYYLIQLPDESYILALFDSQYISKISSDKDFRLPIGKRLQTTKEVLSPLLSFSNRYDVDTSNTLYMFDDSWYQSIDNKVFWIKLAIAFGVFIVLSVLATVFFRKVFTE